MWRKILPLLVLLAFRSYGQQYNYFINGFLQQPNAPQARAYLGISNNAPGSGTVSNFSMGSFAPLFTSSVTTPTTYPHVTFSPIGQSSHLFFASPTSGAGFPAFRAIDISDLPPIGGTGTVTNFSSGDLSPLFTTTVANPTTDPALSYTLDAQNANKVFAGPTSGGSADPTFRSLVSGDIPSLSSIYLPLTGGTMSGTIIGPEVDMAKVQVANLWDNGAGLINLNSPLVINDAGANGSINDRNNNVVIDPLGNITTYGTAEIETYFMLMDRMAGKTGDNITNVGNIVLNNSSGAGQVLDMAGNPLLDPLSGHVGSGKNLTDILLSITNASLNVDATRLTMVKSSNSPIASIKSLSAGANVTLTDQGTNVVIASTGGGGGGGTSIDLAMTNLTAFANSTNFYVDFAFPAATLTTSSNVINFNFATNWGLVNTTRVCNVTIPWTNYGRIVAFSGFATNWRVQPPVYFIPMGYSARMEFSSFGPLDTNVTLNTFFDPTPAGSNTTASFNPTNAFPGVVKLWVDASRGAFQDETLTVPVVDGSIMRGWNELSGTVTTLTNNATTAMVNVWHSPQGAPFNVTCCSIQNGANWLQSPAFTALSGQIWGFVMYYGRSGGNVIDATAGTRFAINPAQMGQVSSFFAGSGLTFTAARQASWTLYACLGNGVSSVMRSNGVVAVSGNAGNPTPSQWIVFGDNTKVNMIGTYNVAEILILNTNLSNTQLTNVESYFYRKYPFWNPPTVQ